MQHRALGGTPIESMNLEDERQVKRMLLDPLEQEAHAVGMSLMNDVYRRTPQVFES